MALEFHDDDHVIVGCEGGRVEIHDVSEKPLPVDAVNRLAAASRWRLEHGRAVDRTAAAHP